MNRALRRLALFTEYPRIAVPAHTWPADRLLELAPAYWQKALQQRETQDKLNANVFRRVVLSPPS